MTRTPIRTNTRKTLLAVLAAAAAMSLLATAPAEAGRRTGSWRYSPEEIYAAQEAQREAAWRERRWHHWQAERYGDEGPGYGRPVYGRPAYGYREDWHRPRYDGWSDE